MQLKIGNSCMILPPNFEQAKVFIDPDYRAIWANCICDSRSDCTAAASHIQN